MRRPGGASLAHVVRALLDAARRAGCLADCTTSTKGPFGLTPIGSAARRGDAKCIEALWAASPLAAPFGGGTDPGLGAEKQQQQQQQQLERGPPPTTPLLVCAASCTDLARAAEVVGGLLASLLKAAGASDVATAGVTAEGASAIASRVAAVVDQRSPMSKGGTTALEAAARAGSVTTVTLLRQAGAKPPPHFPAWRQCDDPAATRLEPLGVAGDWDADGQTGRLRVPGGGIESPASLLLAAVVGLPTDRRRAVLKALCDPSPPPAVAVLPPSRPLSLFRAMFDPARARLAPSDLSKSDKHPCLAPGVWASAWVDRCAEKDSAEAVSDVLALLAADVAAVPADVWKRAVALAVTRHQSVVQSHAAGPFSPFAGGSSATSASSAAQLAAADAPAGVGAAAPARPPSPSPATFPDVPLPSAAMCASAIVANSGALAICARKGGTDFARSLLALGANPEGRPGGPRPICEAAGLGVRGEALVGLLLESGASAFPTEETMHSSPLVRAVQGGSAATVRKLLERGAMASVDTQDGRTTTFLALERGDHAVLQALLAAPDGASASNILFVWSDRGENLVHAAVRGGNAACLALVLGLGAEPDHFDSKGATPLFRAAESSNSECMLMLLRAGASPELVVSSALRLRGLPESAEAGHRQVAESTSILLDRAMRLLQREASGKRARLATDESSSSGAAGSSGGAAAAGAAVGRQDSVGGSMDLEDLAAALASVVQSASGMDGPKPRPSARSRALAQPAPPHGPGHGAAAERPASSQGLGAVDSPAVAAMMQALVGSTGALAAPAAGRKRHLSDSDASSGGGESDSD
ncbi:hypothetical protein FNF31_03097 [Cafeteria roenbergensis]|uniref:Uncharacterized protein n=2 Tax=Cafeteria roenbergensis TaxID=33653 RepID=A0A5A8DBF9_CAFRO|nr:hypothetical protein FNF31_03097 [Cafeteria roenbergensis]